MIATLSIYFRWQVAAYSTAHNQIEIISGSGADALRFRYIEVLSLFHPVLLFLIKNVVHSLEPCGTPSNSASHRAPNFAQRF